jgi:hypothetical protein
MTDPKTLGFEYKVRLAVSLPIAWTTLMKRVAASHYDSWCRESGKAGVINGLHNTVCDGEYPSSYAVSWRDLDLITKVMEQAAYHVKEDADLAAIARAIHAWLRATKDAIETRHRAIEAHFDGKVPCEDKAP